MIEPSVARRYARALLSLALEGGAARDRQEIAEKLGAQLAAVTAALARSSEARSALLDPGYSTAQRQQVVGTLAQSLHLDPLLVNFLRLLVDRQRMPVLPSIARAYGEMVDALTGRVRATVTAAQPLSDGELSAVRDALGRAVQRKVVVEGRTDPALLGGLVAEVGGTLFDGSLRTQLRRLREQLKQGPV